ncbi:hydantoinase B/oxoprolinase family protein [Chloroflexota bacterium]
MAVDPITLAVIRGAIDSIALEMDNTLASAAFSTSMAEGRDFGNGIFEAETGEVITQGSESLPYFVGVMQFVIQDALTKIDINDLCPGDIFITNDVYFGGSHLMDVRFFKPFFYDGKLSAWLENIGHWVDIGGNVPGGFNPLATEIFQEGLIIPPVKLYNDGKINKDILAFVMNNVRRPREDYGDLMSAIKTLHVCEDRLTTLFRRYGRDLMLDAFTELKARSEQQMRSYVREIPDGIYTAVDYMDNNGVTNEPLTINLKLKVKGDEIIFDFTGTSEAQPTFANMIGSTTKTSCYVAMKMIFPDVPINAGCYRPYSFILPEDCFINSQPPHATTLNPEITGRVVDCVMQTLSQAIPQKVYACNYATSNMFTIAGNDPLKGKWQVFGFWGGGLGGYSRGDGLTHGCTACTTAKTQPIEVYEHRFPFLFNRLAIREESAGAGEYRGGFGIEVDMEIARGVATATQTADRGKIAPCGIFGGQEAKRNEVKYYLGGKEFIPPMLTKVTGVKMKQGDRLVINSPGGGGYGDPFKRDADLVLRDVKMEYITAKSAEKDYGVAIIETDGGLAVDRERTAKLR